MGFVQHTVAGAVQVSHLLPLISNYFLAEKYFLFKQNFFYSY
ncbi:hypothetical protein MCSV2_20170 [Mucispirillum schaedleri ASF457]|nr:hypothetical protein MCSV2_20170 [Mucispirillum schaedleri ASF457]